MKVYELIEQLMKIDKNLYVMFECRKQCTYGDVESASQEEFQELYEDDNKKQICSLTVRTIGKY